MPRPIDLQIVLKVLKKEGFFFVSQRGSHAKFRKLGLPTRMVIVKMSKKQIPHGTFQSIILHSGLNESDFRDDDK
ncbi:type II toxin-antitoxin system HicA family toxin [Candidatus Uhrbacteria bacterium]|nr:type II toxin-antitoxin system HicA family toxin [Candidatus Uhrbacteria bacterium]